MYIVSSCLAGINCRFDGGNCRNPLIEKLVADKLAIAVCPEVLGGLPIPRFPSEIKTLKNLTQRIFDTAGNDLTQNFINGANITLNISLLAKADTAILKSKSPSCGFGKIYDGSFTKTLILGNGITANLLFENGIKILSEENLPPSHFL